MPNNSSKQNHPDQQSAIEFLNLLDPTATDFTFQLFYDPDPGDSSAPKLPQKTITTDVMNGWSFLAGANLKKYGVFVTINETDGLGRKTENIVAVRAVFQEDDEGFGSATLPLTPSAIVESSPGKFHRYYLLEEPDHEALEAFSEIQRRLIKSHGSDKACKDLPRVLRVPGFFHWKNPAQPFRVRLVEESEQRYNIEELTEAFPPVAEEFSPGNLAPTGEEIDWAAIHGGVAKGSRNQSAMQLAGSYVGSGKYEYDEVFALMQDWNEQNQPPLKERELIGIVKEVWRREHQQTPLLSQQPPLTAQALPPPSDNGDFLGRFKMQGKDIEKIGDEDWAYENLLIEGQITTLVGRSGSGKTTLLYYIVCPVLAENGYKVLYIDADSPLTEYKRMYACARENSFDFLCADYNPGTNVDELIKELEVAAANSKPLRKHVIIFDTLKKFTDLMRKDRVKKFFKLLRQLSRLGATIVLPGHANKHLGPDGQLIYEGTGDVMADGDNLIFLHERHDGYTTTTTTVVDKNYGAKTRGLFKPIAFRIDTENRTVELTDANLVGPWAMNSNNGDGRRSTVDEEKVCAAAINYIREVGATEIIKFSELAENAAARSGAGLSRTKKILHRHSIKKGVEPVDEVNKNERYFEWEMGGHNNSAKVYFLTEVGRNFQETFDE